MSQSGIIWMCVGICSFIIGSIPLLWGASLFSFQGLIANTIGAFIGIWVGYKLSRYF